MPLTILMGDYGTGKTTTAKHLAKITGGEYIDVDILSHRNGNNNDVTLIEKLKVIVKEDKEYYMDGFPSGSYYGSINHQSIDTDVKFIVCMAAPNVLKKRQQHKADHVVTGLPRSYDEMKNITHLVATIAMTYDDNPIFADTTITPAVFYTKDTWFIRWMELNIYASLKDAGEYQDIELPHHSIPGLSKSYKTWQRLDAMVDFKGKSVIDYGCNYGYFSFKAEEAGAVNVLGVDEAPSVIDMATSIAMVKGSGARFSTAQLRDFKPYDTDIILALNVLHHLKYDNSVLMSMFECAGTIVIEMPVNDAHIVEAVAQHKGFTAPVVSSSHREDRIIAIYSKEKQATVPDKFVYRPRRAAFVKRLYQIARKFIPGNNIPGVKRLKHYIWLRLR